MAAVGAPGAESVFLFHRAASAAAGGVGGVDLKWGPHPVKTMVSSDFDYDMVHLLKIVHRQVRGNVYRKIPNATYRRAAAVRVKKRRSWQLSDNRALYMLRHGTHRAVVKELLSSELRYASLLSDILGALVRMMGTMRYLVFFIRAIFVSPQNSGAAVPPGQTSIWQR